MLSADSRTAGSQKRNNGDYHDLVISRLKDILPPDPPKHFGAYPVADTDGASVAARRMVIPV
ncbi:hypothetical protein BN77_3335 [Rhizobium mesoamericanum STM3625]|uniref:Uncharacterized protein n=1 Tax=Rhizobium mesoamericanum STM3625 TaxID=1211777 RepID=K0PXQ7_9HYPH|nr:hypothetical protein BN77_3335 [Rhizobium mesoamericanum STM3625]